MVMIEFLDWCRAWNDEVIDGVDNPVSTQMTLGGVRLKAVMCMWQTDNYGSRRMVLRVLWHAKE